MAELRPFPFGALVAHALRELDLRGSVFHLPRERFFLGADGLDLSASFHGRRAATPFGPAAGPQSQLAQNLALSWLGGARILELKTVQVDDRLRIPRPCIDAQTVGYNVEWSQELRLEQSLEEYVKGSMLIEVLAAAGGLGLAEGWGDTLFDLSVGYDLAGIRSEGVQAFLRGMRDATPIVDRLRGELTGDLARWRDLDFRTRLSDTLTLSTFHGCPPDEIEAMIRFLMETNGLHSVVKLNPMLLGPERTRELLNERLGYGEIEVPDSAFERDTRWDQAEAFVERLGARADELGLGFGVKFSNTLIVRNHRDFFPRDQREMYLSGRPLHVLAMELVARFRRRFGDRYPISFSAGIERRNFPDAVALGLVPVTVCTDLLRPGGYGRARGYLDELCERMRAVGARDLDDFARRVAGDPALPVAQARLASTAAYVGRLPDDPRYHADANRKVPRKIGSELELFDCITCDKCVPVCPNDANFTLDLPPFRGRAEVLVPRDGGWSRRDGAPLVIEQPHQIANFADFCNDCGNCDVFCPEDGGPYVVKPRFFGSLADWEGFAHLDGFHVEPERIHGRLGGRAFRLDVRGGERRFRGDGFDVRFDAADPAGTARGDAEGEVDLTYARILEWLWSAVTAPDAVGYASALVAAARGR